MLHADMSDERHTLFASKPSQANATALAHESSGLHEVPEKHVGVNDGVRHDENSNDDETIFS